MDCRRKHRNGADHQGCPPGDLFEAIRKGFPLKLEALRPDLRDLSLSARIAGSGASLALAPAIPALSRRSELLPSSALPSAQVFKALSLDHGTGKNSRNAPNIAFTLGIRLEATGGPREHAALTKGSQDASHNVLWGVVSF